MRPDRLRSVTTSEETQTGIRPLVAAVGQGPTNGRYLTREEAREALDAILDGRATQAQAGALLLLQRYRGEAPEELLGYVDALRARMRGFSPAVGGHVDIGSPYDGRTKHVVISPAASIVAAAAGVPVVMHGERDLGPKKGLAVGEVLAALGVNDDAEPDAVARGIDACGLGYVRQARLLPSLHALKPLREELGLRTPLHMVEKIYGPGNAPYHLIGVAHMPYLKQLAPALAGLGYRRTMVVQGIEGHEDVTTSRGARVIEIDEHGEQEEWRLDAEALGLTPATDDDLAPGDAERSAQMTLSVFDGSASAVGDGPGAGQRGAAHQAGWAARQTWRRRSRRRAWRWSRGEAMRRLEAWRQVGR